MEKLAGRLNWEWTANGIRVEIPGWMGWRTLFFCFWITFWTWGGWLAFKATSAHRSTFLQFWLVLWAAGEMIVGRSIFWSFFGKTILTLDPANLNLAWCIFGVELRNRRVATNEIHYLRYQPRAQTGRTQNPGAICFESGSRTYRFGGGIADVEAFTLIDKMLEVYPFPKERALEYLDLTR